MIWVGCGVDRSSVALITRVGGTKWVDGKMYSGFKLLLGAGASFEPSSVDLAAVSEVLQVASFACGAKDIAPSAFANFEDNFSAGGFAALIFCDRARYNSTVSPSGLVTSYCGS